MRALLILMFSFLMPLAALATQPVPATASALQTETTFLLDHLEQSGCKFQRNGSWYTAKEARAHLTTKYDYLVKKNLLQNVEDFIEKGATESSMSGKPYQVACDGSATVSSKRWLSDALRQYRMRDGSLK